MLLTCHSFNLFVDFVSSVLSGRFDSACYLARPLTDVAAILRHAGGSDAIAEEFMRGTDTVKASAARIEAVAQLRSIDPNMAEEVDRIYREDARDTNVLSHVNVTQLSKLVDRSGPEARNATLAGRVDVQEAINMLRLAIYGEVMTLAALRQVGEFGKKWDDRCVRAVEGSMAWSRAQHVAQEACP